ncbi:MAG: hypothetical protein IT428_18295 [Planctomycetaceae bacterium]|nr:hypothetical protein [Planctomycetaceae bacterium]
MRSTLRSALWLLASVGLSTTGCTMLPCSHPHDAVCEELEDRSCTSLIAYCPCLDVNCIGCQPWFRPASCLATDRRQRFIERRPQPPIPRLTMPQ